jgi:hypothetical protein
MADGFIKAVKEYAPQAKIVFDRSMFSVLLAMRSTKFAAAWFASRRILSASRRSRAPASRFCAPSG